MNDTQPNLFSNLFQWRPRDTKLSEENFLTEAFVYCLQVNPKFRLSWLGQILDRDMSSAELVITTRASHIDDEHETTIYPDIDIRGTFADGKTVALLIEVKWGAHYDSDQMKKYDRLLGKEDFAHLVLLSPSGADCHRARNDSTSFRSTFKAIQWEKVHSDLSKFSADCRTTKELEEFMDRQGLSAMKPISIDEIDHFLASRNVMRGLKRYCEKLLHEYNWDFLPIVYQEPEQRAVSDQFGRMAIVFRRANWNGAITVGFLYSNHDHKVRFADGTDNSIDLMMRIECAPSADGRDGVVAALRQKVKDARACGGIIRAANEPDNPNRHTLFIAQRSLSDFLGIADEAGQLTAMHTQIEAWATALFKDGVLACALASFDR